MAPGDARLDRGWGAPGPARGFGAARHAVAQGGTEPRELFPLRVWPTCDRSGDSPGQEAAD
eukprot:14707578-Heterocapsa_arctica.AAC.1